MAKNLVIVESPAKARTLEKFLGKDFSVEACGGHIRDLPAKSLGVKIDKDFEPNYQIIKGKEKIVKELKSAANKAKVIYLAPDPDREGEAIAWHLKVLLGGNGKVKRIEFHEITKEAVTAAVKHPRELDLARVDAQQARRILDRLVGYKLSPLLWKKVRKGLSAGRVQSVAVRLICEREEEIGKFKKEEYWDILTDLANQAKTEFSAKLVSQGDSPLGVRPKEKGKVIGSEAEAKRIAQALEGAAFTVKEVRRKEQKRHPAPPFITSTLQQEAARKLGFSAKKTMTLAQKLYEGEEVKGHGRVGLITYMRTDSVRIAHEAEHEVRKYINDHFGKQFIPAEPIRYRKKKQAQDAHEAIRPTAVLRSPDKLKDDLKGDEFKLYELIWKRFVACQMEAAVFDQTAVDISAGEYLLRANGSVIKFEGFLKLYVESTDDNDTPEEKEGLLPPLQQGEKLRLVKVSPAQHFTEPPPRYTEASLVKELELRGIGRPSTYAPIISTVQERGYVTREGKALKPTEIGVTTNGLLVKHFPLIMDIKFTARMEDRLDEVAEGQLAWVEALKEFYGPFKEALAEADVKMEKVKTEIMTDEICPTCGSKLVIREGRFGRFIACSTYPKCKFTKNLPEEEARFAALQEKCDKCGKPMVVKRGRFGEFLACSGYPECKNIKPILKKLGVKCPKCGDGELAERRTKKGRIFYGCSNYPKCDFATWQRPVPGETPKAAEKKKTDA
ncbi:MAG: type I DNA topoisomerase [Candidatus Margulisbacteria bacterium]|jgi:DNA topoisomerase-1|nr:type I DNA topoisomerase [Candidatus Margulisiibacteriota bacterium]